TAGDRPVILGHGRGKGPLGLVARVYAKRQRGLGVRLVNLPRRLPRSGRAWIGLSVLAPLGMLVMSGLMLLDLRRDAWDKSEQTSRNLLQVIERDIARNVEIIDLSLQAVVDNLLAPETAEASPRARQMILFDRAATAKDLGVMLVLDENGDSILD